MSISTAITVINVSEKMPSLSDLLITLVIVRVKSVR